MLALGAYQAAFALHDGPAEIATYEQHTARSYLRDKWASFGALFHFQPMDVVRKYFGEAVGACCADEM